MNLPQKEDFDDEQFIKIKENGKTQVFINVERTIGIATKQLPSGEFLNNTAELTWDNFRIQNLKNIFIECYRG
jgi:hypothetical protein